MIRTSSVASQTSSMCKTFNVLGCCVVFETQLNVCFYFAPNNHRDFIIFYLG